MTTPIQFKDQIRMLRSTPTEGPVVGSIPLPAEWAYIELNYPRAKVPVGYFPINEVALLDK